MRPILDDALPLPDAKQSHLNAIQRKTLAMQPLTDALTNNTSIAIIGMGKNAGKTTVLNQLLSLLEKDKRTIAVASIGRDGEAVDVVTGTAKPGIWVKRGSLVVTTTGLVRECDITREIIMTTGISTPLGEVVVLRALSDGAVQLSGPSMAEQLQALMGELRTLGALLTLVDGAIHRKTFANPAICDAVILCVGASGYPDMEEAIRDSAYACKLLQLPQSQGDHPQRRILQGAVTDRTLQALCLQKGDEICAQDSSHFILPEKTFDKYTVNGIFFTVERTSNLCCVCINPYAVAGPSYDANDFMQRMRKAVTVPVVNVKEARHDHLTT